MRLWENRLRFVIGREGFGCYAYDALGRRILRFAVTFKRKEAPCFSTGMKRRNRDGKRQRRSDDTAADSNADSSADSDAALRRWLDGMATDLQFGCRYGLRHLVRLMDGARCRLPWRLRRRIVLERYFYDGADVIADYGLFGRRVKATYLTPFLDENLLVERCGNRFWFTQDGLGSVRRLFDDSSRITNSYAYTAWGMPLNWHESIPNRHTFTGREWNSESSLYYYRLRSYFPCFGRFVRRDTIFQSNMYFYADNNPVRYTDPTGLDITLQHRKGKKKINNQKIKGYLIECKTEVVQIGAKCEKVCIPDPKERVKLSLTRMVDAWLLVPDKRSKKHIIRTVLTVNLAIKFDPEPVAGTSKPQKVIKYYERSKEHIKKEVVGGRVTLPITRGFPPSILKEMMREYYRLVEEDAKATFDRNWHRPLFLQKQQCESARRRKIPDRQWKALWEDSIERNLNERLNKLFQFALEQIKKRIMEVKKKIGK